ncbi:MAG: glycosyltransferase family 1 protein [Actinomycetota bacterium]
MHEVSELNMRGDQDLDVGSLGPMRIAIVAESFLPAINGVTNSILRVIEHMTDRGHEVTVIAPSPGVTAYGKARIIRVPSFGFPRYPELRIGHSRDFVRDVLTEIKPDVVHLGSPAVLGAASLSAAQELGIPSVAIYQTDLAGFASRYHLGLAGRSIWRYIANIHRRADLTLAPSTAAVWDLRERGVNNVVRWMRGVDLERFNPSFRDEELRRSIAPDGQLIIGFVGRLAREKQIERLKSLCRMPHIKVVIVGDGPVRAKLEKELQGAIFMGFKSGEELSKLYASFDVFVHTGTDETFCQAVQEALASGVPVVAPASGGPLDLVQHGHNGFLWTEASRYSLVGAVAELAKYPVKRERLAANARPSVEVRPWCGVMDELEGHYRSVIGGLSFAYRGVAA